MTLTLPAGESSSVLASSSGEPSSRSSGRPVTSSHRADITRWMAGLHDELTSFFGRLDRGGTFIEDRW